MSGACQWKVRVVEAGVAVLVVGLGCSSGGGPPDTRPDLPLMTNSTEVRSENYQSARDFYIEHGHALVAVDDVFEALARIHMGWSDYGNSLSRTVANPGDAWPDPLTSYFYFDNQAYIQRDPSKSFALYAAYHSSGMDTLGCFGSRPLGVASGAYPQAVHTVSSDVRARWAYVFVRDIEIESRLCEATPDARAFINNAVAHELGHERAGLTDFQDIRASFYVTFPPRTGQARIGGSRSGAPPGGPDDDVAEVHG